MIAFWFCFWEKNSDRSRDVFFFSEWIQNWDEFSSQFWIHSERKRCTHPGCIIGWMHGWPGHGETGVVYVTERDGGGRPAGGSWWWGGRSQGFRPRRRRLSLRCGGIAVVAAVRSDSTAVSQCALLFLSHVSTIFVPKEFFFFYLFLSALSCARDNPRGDISRADSCDSSQFFSATRATSAMMDSWEIVCACGDLRKNASLSHHSRPSQLCADE